MTVRTDGLERLAFGAARTEPILAAKASALCTLAEMTPPPVAIERLRAELRRVAKRDAISARGLAGVLRALRALEALEATDELVWPSETPDAPAPPGYWPYENAPDSPWAVLDAVNTMGVRDRWRARHEAPPPWLRRSPAA